MAVKPALKSVEQAKGKAAVAPGDAAAEAPKKKRKLPLIVGLLVLVLSASGGAAWYFLRGDPASADKHDVVVEKEKKLTLYVPLEGFTVNLQGEGDHYLQVGMTLQVTDNGTADEIKQQMPLLRNRLLLLLSAQTPADLATVEGKQKLSTQVLAESRKLISAKTADEGIQNVLFSSFVIQ